MDFLYLEEKFCVEELWVFLSQLVERPWGCRLYFFRNIPRDFKAKHTFILNWLVCYHLWSVHICYFPQIGYTWLDFLFLLLLLRIPLLRNLKNICIVMTNFMHAVIAIFLLKQSDPSIHFIFIVNTCNIKAENLVPILPWAT